MRYLTLFLTPCLWNQRALLEGACLIHALSWRLLVVLLAATNTWHLYTSCKGAFPEAPWVTPVAEEVTEGLIWGPQDFYPTSDCSPEQEGAAAQSLGEYALRTSHWWGLAKATGIANPSLNPGSHIDGKEMKGKGLHWTLTRK